MIPTWGYRFGFVAIEPKWSKAEERGGSKMYSWSKAKQKVGRQSPSRARLAIMVQAVVRIPPLPALRAQALLRSQRLIA